MTDYDEVRVELMRPGQIRGRREKADVAFLPLGSLEWHGVHNPVGTDSVKAHHICCVAATKLGGGAVFPALMMALPRDSMFVTTRKGYIEPIARALGTDAERVRGVYSHGGMDLQEQWLFYQRMLRMALENIMGFGFRSVYLLTGHYPLIHFAEPVAIAFSRAAAMAGRPVTTDWSSEFEAAGLIGDHGGKWETSHMMAISPDAVDLGELERQPEYVDLGAERNAAEATREQGEAWIDQCAEAIAREARWLVEHWPKLPDRHRHRR